MCLHKIYKTFDSVDPIVQLISISNRKSKDDILINKYFDIDTVSNSSRKMDKF